MENKTAKPRFCVLGAGHGGLAMSAHLGIMGFEVNLYNRTSDRLRLIQARGGIDLLGEIEGFGHIKIATSDIAQAIKDVDILMVVVPALAHRFIAEVCAPHLKDGQIIVLNPGRTFGAIEFKQVLEAKKCRADVMIAEAQTLIYASRMINPGQVKIFRIKNSIPVASIQVHHIPEVLKVINQAFPQFVPGDNVFKTSLDNIGSIFHPAICILNSGWIENEHEFQFYLQGATPSVAKVLEQMDAERVAVAAALGIQATTAKQWLYLAYDATGKNLHDAIQANSGYQGIMAPRTLNTRYVSEDVPMSLVPIASVGKMLGVETHTIRNIIQIASVIDGVDYWKKGRTVERLGINGMSVKDLRFLAIGAETNGLNKK